MVKFDELRGAYRDWRKRGIAYHDASVAFAGNFARGFREYIGAPATYNVIDDTTKKFYVEARKITDEGKLVRAEHPGEVLTFEEDGYYKFGLTLTLDYDENSYPKAAFGFTVHYQAKNDVCDLKVSDKAFTVKLTDEGAFNPAYDFLVEMLKQSFSREPWQMDEKRQIGFVHLGKD